MKNEAKGGNKRIAWTDQYNPKEDRDMQEKVRIPNFRRSVPDIRKSLHETMRS